MPNVQSRPTTCTTGIGICLVRLREEKFANQWNVKQRTYVNFGHWTMIEDRRETKVNKRTQIYNFIVSHK